MRRALAEPRLRDRQRSRLGEAVPWAAIDETSATAYETQQFHTTSFLVRDGNVLKRGWLTIAASPIKGVHHDQAVLLNGYNRFRDCCCRPNRLVALRYAT